MWRQREETLHSRVDGAKRLSLSAPVPFHIFGELHVRQRSASPHIFGRINSARMSVYPTRRESPQSDQPWDIR
jgi:hypothetical protein